MESADDSMLSSQGPYAPIPGTAPMPRGLFVDRWGTLLRTPARGYAKKPSELEFYDGALDALFRACQAGWTIYLLGNEDAVALGDLPLAAWKEVEQRILEELGGAGVAVARSYACVDRPDGVSGRNGDSVYQLPNTGAFYHAVHTDGLELRKSWVIGDSTLELVAGWRAGCRTAGVETGAALADGAYAVDPELVGADLREVVLTVLTRQEAWT